MTAHTPGPWRHDRALSDGGAPMITADRGWMGLPRRIAKVLYEGGSEDPEVMANARLIESATDLYAALSALVEPCECYGREMGKHGRLCDQARAALAKARGEAVKE